MKKIIISLWLVLIWTIFWYFIAIVSTTQKVGKDFLFNTGSNDQNFSVEEKTYFNRDYWYSISYLSYYHVDDTQKDYVTFYPKWCNTELCSDFLCMSIETNPLDEFVYNRLWSIESLYKERKNMMNDVWGDCQLLHKDPILESELTLNTSLQYVRCYYPGVFKQDKSTLTYYVFWSTYVHTIDFLINKGYAAWYDEKNNVIQLNQFTGYDSLWDYMMQTFKLLN